MTGDIRLRQHKGLNMSRSQGTLSTAWSTVFGFLLLALVGCGEPVASVSGTVKFKGQPLTSGTVLFHGSDARVEHSLIDANGKYVIPKAPLGQVRITVRWHAATPSGLPGHGKPPAASTESASSAKDKRDSKSLAIPPRYLDPDRSGITYTVKVGTQTHNIELEP
jgi:hypothetical protein